MFNFGPIVILIILAVIAATIGFFVSAIDSRKGRQRPLETGLILGVVAMIALSAYVVTLYLFVVPPAAGASLAVDFSGLAIGCSIAFLMAFTGAVLGYTMMMLLIGKESPVESIKRPTEETRNPYQPPAT